MPTSLQPNTDTQTSKAAEIALQSINALYAVDISLWDEGRLQQLTAYLRPFLPEKIIHEIDLKITNMQTNKLPLHTQVELSTSGHQLYIPKENGKGRIIIANAGVQDWGLDNHNTPKIDHEGLANTAELAKRWNAHNKLVEALQRLVRHIDSLNPTLEMLAIHEYCYDTTEAKQLLNQLNEKP